MEINEKLKVSDGMGAWIKDFQESDAPQFNGKSEKERREMAIAAYMSAKKGDMNESADLDEAFTDKEIKMAYGILNDPRYKSGNLTKAVDKIEQIKKGLSKHPGVQRAMKATTESLDEAVDLDENFAEWKKKVERRLGNIIFGKWKYSPYDMVREIKKMKNSDLFDLYKFYHGTKLSQKSMDRYAGPIAYNLVKREIERRFPGLDPSKGDPTKPGQLNLNLDEAVRNLKKIEAKMKSIPEEVWKDIETVELEESFLLKALATLGGMTPQDVAKAFFQGTDQEAKKRGMEKNPVYLQFVDQAKKEFAQARTVGQAIDVTKRLKPPKATSESLDEEVWKEIETYAIKHGGIDKKDMLKVSMMLKKGDRKGAIKFARTLDTDPRDWLLDKMNESIKESAEINENNTKFTSADQWMAAALKAGKPAFMMNGKNIVALFDRNLRGEWQSAKGYGHLPTALVKESVQMKSIEAIIQEAKGGSGPRSMFVKDSGDDHIIMQLRSAQDLSGMKKIKFRGGKEGQVDKMDIDTVLKVHDMLSPEGKRKLRIMVSKSPADLVKAATELRKAMK